VAQVFRRCAYGILTGATGKDEAVVLLAIHTGNRCVLLHCCQTAGPDTIHVAAVSLLLSVHIDWDRGTLRLDLDTHGVTSRSMESEPVSEECWGALAEGRQFLEFLGVCPRIQPRLEALTAAHRGEIVLERLHRSNPHRR
jgi:hypothetical protein